MPDPQVDAQAGGRGAVLDTLPADLTAAGDVDEITLRVLAGLAAVPGVLRVGVALSEGGGRRLRYAASNRLADDGVGWCHIDAYDDVPLTAVVRTGAPILGDRAQLDRQFPDFGGRQDPSVQGVAAVPLPGVGGPIGGFLLMLDRPWNQVDVIWRRLETTARVLAEAVRRARVSTSGDWDEVLDVEGDRLVLDDDPRSAGLARRFLREVVARHDDVSEDVADTAELCLSELVTNALVHAGGESELRILVADGVLSCSVRDRGASGGPADPAGEVLADPLRVHGRGLQLIDALVDRWGSERDAGGSTTWFALRVG